MVTLLLDVMVSLSETDDDTTGGEVLCDSHDECDYHDIDE